MQHNKNILHRNNIYREILKIIMRKKRSEIVHTGSFALYYIKSKKRYDNEAIKLKINDIDIDLNKNLLHKIDKGIQFNVYDKLAFRKGIESYVNDKLLGNELYERFGIVKYRVIIDRDNIKFRKGNRSTLGFSFEIKIYNTLDGVLSVYFDVNLESKSFDIDKSEFVMDGETFEVNTYSYNKILADKLIATKKHLTFILDDLMHGIELSLDDWNLKKLAKDLYDINYITNLKKHNLKNVIDYIFMMVNNFNEENINQIYKIIELYLNKNPFIFQYRDNANTNDLYNLVNIIKSMFIEEHNLI